MAGFYTHGPTLTYVTDPSLSTRAQQRVLQEFVRCSGEQLLRVAFRLPGAEDGEVFGLVAWYQEIIERLGVTETMLPPLIHNRPGIVQRFPGTELWLPASMLTDLKTANAYSVHTIEEATRAIEAGAKELIFGHVFDSASHPGIPGRGTDLLRELRDQIRTDINTPVITAIGGIDNGTIGGIGRSRIFNVAVIRAISQSRDIARTLESIRRNWVTALVDEDLNDPEPLAFGRPWGIWHRWEADERLNQEVYSKGENT